MHLDHDHIVEGEHTHEHTHSHSHEHTHDGHTHTHEHHHAHAHSHEHPHSHEHLHEHGHAHSHDHDHNHTSMEQLLALMKYMVDHNAAHAKELEDLAVKLDEAGHHASYHKVMDAVACFEKGNEMLAEVLSEQK